VDGIKEQLKGNSDDAKNLGVYQYNFGDPSSLDIDSTARVQTYLVTYPLFDTTLDFGAYVDGLAPGTVAGNEGGWPITIPQTLSMAMEMAYNSSGKPPGENLDYDDWKYIPFPDNKITISLGDLKSLVSNITFDNEEKVSIVIDVTELNPGAREALQKAVRIRAPQIKIGNSNDVEGSWVTGKWGNEEGSESVSVSEATQLVFKNSEDNAYDNTEALLLKTGEPDTDKVEIEIKLANKIAAGTYTLKINFNWYSVDVKPQGDAAALTGGFEGFDLGSYLNIFADEGTEVKFKSVPAFFYVKFPSELTGFGVAITKSDGTPLGDEDDEEDEEDEDAIKIDPNDIVEAEDPLPEWLTTTPMYKYEFADIFNDGDGIKYIISPPESVTVKYSELDITDADSDANKITANLAVLLPMVFNFSAIDDDDKFTISGSGENAGDYIPIKFEGLDEFLEGGGDSDSVMKQLDDTLAENGGNLKTLTLQLKSIENGVTGENLYLAIAKDPNAEVKGEHDASDWVLVNIANGKDANVNLRDGISDVSLSSLPKIKFLIREVPIKEDSEEKAAIFYIQDQSDKEKKVAFDVNISVVAGISLNKEIGLQ
jgi:hypothetical protein